MAEIDNIASTLLEQSKRFLEKAAGTEDGAAQEAYLHAALMLSFSSLEGHVNSICTDFAGRPELSLHEKAFLLEEEVRLDAGVFKKGGLKMSRLEDRILFLFARFSKTEVDRTDGWWPRLSAATRLRNKLTHPKDQPSVSLKATSSALEAIVDVLDALYRAIYKRGFPAAKRRLQSNLTF